MARVKRSFVKDGIYHILNRGNGRQKVFLKDGDYAAFVDLIEESRKHFDFKLYAYCVMPNHFHFVVTCPEADIYRVHCDEYLLTVLRYVEANPCRAGLVDSAELWSWSSFGQRVGLHADGLLDKPPVELPVAWSDWVNRAIGESELKTIRGSVNRQTPYGPSRWQKEICHQFGIESTLKPLGRPKIKRGQSPFP